MGGRTFLRRLFNRQKRGNGSAAPARQIGPDNSSWNEARQAKIAKLRPFLRTDLTLIERDGKLDFLSDKLRAQARIVDTDKVSSNGYDQNVVDMIARHQDGLILDCGAGKRDLYYDNVVNYEIVDYASTDVLGIGEVLPFKDSTFDAVISVAVLEHVRDPFRCAEEIARVLKPGGELYCCVPFLQPLHGYPHHYFNATSQGIRALFEDRLDVLDVKVIYSTHPIWSLTWILDSWRHGLPPEVQADFDKMTVADLLSASALDHLDRPFCATLSKEKQLELASATVLTALKPLAANASEGSARELK